MTRRRLVNVPCDGALKLCLYFKQAFYFKLFYETSVLGVAYVYNAYICMYICLYVYFKFDHIYILLLPTISLTYHHHSSLLLPLTC